MLKRLFILNTDDKLSWMRIILWWEFRRIFYNFYIILSGIISLIILSFIIKDLGSFLTPAFGPFIMTVIFIILANICYTSGWIFQLITRNTKNAFIKHTKPKIFIYGLIFTFLVQLLPSIFAGIYTIVTGERIKSPYADFTIDKPNINDIIGNYKLSKATIEHWKFPNNLATKTIIKYNANNTFEFKYFPYHDDFFSTKYKIVNASGTWEMKMDQGHWVIPMNFNSIINSLNGQKLKTFANYNGFSIRNNKSPYEIYIVVGDPDSWEGIILEKEIK